MKFASMRFYRFCSEHSPVVFLCKDITSEVLAGSFCVEYMLGQKENMEINLLSVICYTFNFLGLLGNTSSYTVNWRIKMGITYSSNLI